MKSENLCLAKFHIWIRRPLKKSKFSSFGESNFFFFFALHLDWKLKINYLETDN